MILVFDADILSTLLKTGGQKLLPKLYPQAKLIVPASVFAELKKGIFQGRKLSVLLDKEIFEIVKIKKRELKELKETGKKLHSGERAAIASAKKLKAIFLSNDQVALEIAKELRVETQSLKQLLITLAKKKIVKKDQMIKLLKEIEEKDYTVVLGQEDILEICE